MTTVRCYQTNLPKKDRKPVTDAVRVLWQRIVDGAVTSEESSKDSSKKRNKAGRVGDFAKALKHSLDKNFKSHWHVMAGESISFACKNREKTVGIWHILQTDKSGDGSVVKSNEKMTVIIWKSPGLEPLESTESEEAVAPSGDSPDSPDAADASSAGKELHIVRPAAEEVEEGSQVARAIDVMRDVLRDSSSEDVQMVKELRRRLTRELGTIWHVAAGSTFVIEPAENCRNFVLASFGKDMRIVCFQHEQMQSSRIEWSKVVSALPWLMVVLACFIYMSFQGICTAKTETSGPGRGSNFAVRWFEENVCPKQDWESEVGIIVVITLGCSMAAKKYMKMKSD